jgi:hypothetical protein
MSACTHRLKAKMWVTVGETGVKHDRQIGGDKWVLIVSLTQL